MESALGKEGLEISLSFLSMVVMWAASPPILVPSKRKMGLGVGATVALVVGSFAKTSSHVLWNRKGRCSSGSSDDTFATAMRSFDPGDNDLGFFSTSKVHPGVKISKSS